MKHLLLAIALGLSSLVSSQTPAFPGAEGFGRYTSGGRGGTVYYVNTLEDNLLGNSVTREGSLRWCLSRQGTKTILFKVSGTIFLQSPLSINLPNVTLAGQSAPGDGVAVGGQPVTISASNVIVRYLRFRMGDQLNTNADGADALGARKYQKIMIDHCSMSWSTDECVSIYENQNTTVQWCIIAESLRLSGHSKGPHGYGGIWGGANASFLHNLMANNDSRTPRFGPGSTTQLKELVDMRNCVVYNWTGLGCYGAEGMKVNMVNNYFKPGPGSPTGSKRAKIIGIDKKTGLSSSDTFYPINNVWGQFYIDGNVVDHSTSTSTTDINSCKNATADNWTYGVYNQINSAYGITTAEKTALKMPQPFETDVVTTHPAALAYQKVLEYAGASLHRDSHDARIVNETRTGTAAFKGLSPYNGLGSVTYPAGTVIGSTTLTVTTTIDWKSTSYPKKGIIDSQTDIKPADAPVDWSPWPILASGDVPEDTDIDGIPDGWLDANYPGKISTDVNADGFTLLEVYLNQLVNDITVNQNSLWSVGLRSTSRSEISLSVVNSQLKLTAADNIDSVGIFSLLGSKLMEKNGHAKELVLDLSGLPYGVYVVKLKIMDQCVNRKITLG